MPKLKSSSPKKAKQQRVKDELHKFKEGKSGAYSGSPGTTSKPESDKHFQASSVL